MKSKWIRTLALTTFMLGGLYVVESTQESHEVYAESQAIAFNYSKDVVDTLNEINRIRKAMGVEVLKIDPRLSKSADSHAKYVYVHGLSHDQIKGKSGFTGRDFVERARAAGYNIQFGGEVISQGGNMTNKRLIVTDFIEGIYHRDVIIGSSFDTVGIGVYKDVIVIVVDNADRSNNKGYAYPYHGQKDAPRVFDIFEIPDPLEKYNEKISGYIISYTPMMPLSNKAISQNKNKMFLKDSKGRSVALLNRNNVPDLWGNTLYIIPKSPLQKGETYTATIQFYDSKEKVQTYSWSFTTKRTNSAPTAVYNQYYQRFADFNHNECWVSDMMWAIDRGLIQGYSNVKNTRTGMYETLLKPYGTLTEAHFLTMLFRYAKPQEYKYARPTSNWVYNVQYQLARKYNLPTRANETSTAKKNIAMQGIKRGTLAQILVSLDHGKPVNETYAIKVLIDRGITTARTPAEFRANEPLTRSQAAAFLHRYDDYVKN